MSPPRLIACAFDSGEKPSKAAMWTRLARVLAYTATQQCADWDVQVRTVTPAVLKSPSNNSGHVHNTQKMEHWYEAVKMANDGDRLLLIDADTVILRPLDEIWDRPFDYAYTIKQSRFPFNSGVVFLRVSPAVRAFVTEWRNENRRMLESTGRHAPWRRQYGGINQAALGSLVSERDAYGRPRTIPALAKALHILPLPCREWNCEDSSWPHFDPTRTRILHVKSALRRAVFGGIPDGSLSSLVDLWKRLEREATTGEQRRTA